MVMYKKLAEKAAKNNQIDLSKYERYKVKRGLRNADGSGVLVGLTTISTAIGYEKIDEDVIPIEGQLHYRGINLKELVGGFEREKRFGFEETAYLLLFGELPTPRALEEFRLSLGRKRLLPKNFARDVIETFRTNNIMMSLARSILTLYSIDKKPEDLSTANQVKQAMNLIAKIGTLIPYSYYSIQAAFEQNSMIIHKPDPALSMAENFLHLLRPDSKYTDFEAKTLDMAMVLHADHGGGNNSTFTARVISSTNTDIYSAMTAALGSLKGPLHGGASHLVSEMMNDLKTHVKDFSSRKQVRKYLFKLLAKEGFDGSGKIYGVGHAVYTLSDPRAKIFRRYARELARRARRSEEFGLYELVALEAPRVLAEFKKNPELKSCINVDFYSGFVYDCLGIPHAVFNAIFAMARMAGWCAHRLELMSSSGKIMRPAYKAICERRAYQPISQRGRKPHHDGHRRSK